MSLETSKNLRGLGAMTGARYIESLKDGREVWLDGESPVCQRRTTRRQSTDRSRWN